MTGKEETGVFHAQGALEKALHQIAHGSERADKEGKQEGNDDARIADGNAVEPAAMIEDDGAEESEGDASEQTLPTLLGTDMRRHLMIPVRAFGGQAADDVRTAVIHPNQHEQRQ